MPGNPRELTPWCAAAASPGASPSPDPGSPAYGPKAPDPVQDREPFCCGATNAGRAGAA
jgi:hypothetical protein